MLIIRLTIFGSRKRHFQREDRPPRPEGIRDVNVELPDNPGGDPGNNERPTNFVFA